MTFTGLNLVSPLQKSLVQQGFNTPTPIQEKVIPFALEWNDILWCAQTGSGKTLAFALPILNILYKINHQAEQDFSQQLATLDDKARKKAKKNKKIKNIKSLILAPTRELAIQIWESFSPYCTNTNIKHSVIYWGKNQFHQVKALEKGIDILIATPWRLIDLIEQWFVKLDYVKIFTLDEADTVSVLLQNVEDLDLSLIQILCSAHRSAHARGKSFVLPENLPDMFVQVVEDAGFQGHIGCSHSGEEGCIWKDLSKSL